MLGEYLRRIWYLLNRKRLERELEDEMLAHRERMGAPANFGSTLRMREQTRDAWGWNWLEDAARDLWLGLRALRRTPAFTLTSCLILSLGIGLNLALFQIVDVMFLRPLPVDDPHTLLRFYSKSKRGTSSSVPYPVTQYIRRNTAVLSAVLTETARDVAWEDNASDRLSVSFVSANWFTELGYGGARGRVFLEQIDDQPNAPPVAVVSHEFWRTRLGGDPDIADKKIRLNNRPVVVCGVARADFPGLRIRKTQVWLPIHQMPYFMPGMEFVNAWRANSTEMYGRMRPGATPATVKESLRAAVGELARERPNDFGPEPWLDPLSGAMRFERDSDRSERLLATSLALGLTGLVLLVACSNLANLTLLRALGRIRELSVRTALGASRSRILRHLMAESFLLAFAGAGGGLATGYLTARFAAAAADLPAYLDFSPDTRTAIAALTGALLTMILVGLIPIWRVSRCDLNSAIKDGGQQASGSLDRTRLRSVLVGAQVAGSCLLVIMAGMLARGLQRILTADPGFSHQNVVVLDASLRRYGIQGAEARRFWATVSQRIAAHPAVEAVTLASLAPLGAELSEGDFRDAPGLKVTNFNVEPGFFDLMGVTILAGRGFSASDSSAPVVIVSRRLAIEMYGSENVIGQAFPKSGPGEKRQIVGVTVDAHMIKIGNAHVAESYFPLRDNDDRVVLLARARSNPAQVLGPLRQVARLGDDRVLAEARLMTADFEKKLRVPRLISAVAGSMALLSLSLAGLGVFGVTSWSATVRRKEIGIRMALGARKGSVAGLVLRQLAWPTTLGLIAGLAGAIPSSRLLANAVPFVLSDDTTGHVLSLVILATSCVFASMLPAIRVLRTDPLSALRHE